TPIIVMTSDSVEGAREEYLTLGYTNYLSKPLDVYKLEAMIQSYLPDDKIIFTDEVSEKEDEAALDRELITRISKLKGIDVSTGIETAGGEDSYIVICRSFHDMAKKRIEMIKEAFEKDDIDNYIVQIYDFKNSARLIGAYELSKMAQDLENAGREGNRDRVKKETAELLNKYKWYYDRFDEILKKA
ncbi:MAG: response regulator, partial [Lachnospiraceae bacterium]|nr:response regulator [Lachnospiraceae bacterium]